MRKQQAAVPPIAPMRTNQSFRRDTVRDERPKVKPVGDDNRSGTESWRYHPIPQGESVNSFGMGWPGRPGMWVTLRLG